MAWGRDVSMDFAFTPASTGLVQHRVVKRSSNNNVLHTTAVGERCIGVLQNDPIVTTDTADTRTLGASLVNPTSVAVQVGDFLTAATAGMVQVTTETTHFILGWAEEAITASTARAATDVISMIVLPSGRG